jgi:hypothetical protein
MIVIGSIGAFVVLLLNIFATVIALRAKNFLRPQIRNQIILAWLVPIIGAVIVIAFQRSRDDEDPKDGGGNGSDMTDPQLIDNVWIGHNR